MTTLDSLYQTRLDVIQALAEARANEESCLAMKHSGMAELWHFRAKALTEQLSDVQETIEREET